MYVRVIEPARRGPCPVRLDGVDDASDDHRKQDVPVKVASLRDGPRYDGGTGGGKGALKLCGKYSLDIS